MLYKHINFSIFYKATGHSKAKKYIHVNVSDRTPPPRPIPQNYTPPLFIPIIAHPPTISSNI